MRLYFFNNMYLSSIQHGAQGVEGGMDADDPPARRGLFPGGLKSKNALLSPG